MKVQLAYSFTHNDKTYAPDDVVDLDDATARMLIAEGRARVPDDDADDARSATEEQTARAVSGEAAPAPESQSESGRKSTRAKE